MSICSLVVYTSPERMEAVKADIAGREGCEVPAAENGRIIVVIDSPSRDVMSRTIMDLNNIPGVANVAFVYEYFEDGDERAETTDLEKA